MLFSRENKSNAIFTNVAVVVLAAGAGKPIGIVVVAAAAVFVVDVGKENVGALDVVAIIGNAVVVIG